MVKKIEYIECRLDELEADEQELVVEARYSTRSSYSPYSNYKVGAAAVLMDGSRQYGANQENASYSLCLCAERSLMFSLYNEGFRGKLLKIAVTGRPGGVENYVGINPVAPCGACRQVLKEEEDLVGSPITIIMDCFNDNLVRKVVGIDNLLPFAFGPKDLGF